MPKSAGRDQEAGVPEVMKSVRWSGPPNATFVVLRPALTVPNWRPSGANTWTTPSLFDAQYRLPAQSIVTPSGMLMLANCVRGPTRPSGPIGYRKIWLVAVAAT